MMFFFCSSACFRSWGAVGVLDHAQRLLERPDGLVELAVQHPGIGDDDDGVQDTAVVGVVERRELVGQPGDGHAVAAAAKTLDRNE
jgi:hypothetical protein